MIENKFTENDLRVINTLSGSQFEIDTTSISSFVVEIRNISIKIENLNNKKLAQIFFHNYVLRVTFDENSTANELKISFNTLSPFAQEIFSITKFKTSEKYLEILSQNIWRKYENEIVCIEFSELNSDKIEKNFKIIQAEM